MSSQNTSEEEIKTAPQSEHLNSRSAKYFGSYFITGALVVEPADAASPQIVDCFCKRPELFFKPQQQKSGNAYCEAAGKEPGQVLYTVRHIDAYAGSTMGVTPVE